MKIFITLVVASLGVIGVLSQGGGGSAGGLLGGEHRRGLGGGGYHSRGTVIGLSRGIEIERHGRRGGEEEGGEEGGLELGGGGGGGGFEREHEHERERERERERHEERRGGEIGWGGSKFITPVDVHHEEVIHLKAHPEFRYDYHVADHKTKDFKSKHEVRDGYKVKGTYSLLEPDHKTVRVVDYVSDKKRGFVARVTYRKHD